MRVTILEKIILHLKNKMKEKPFLLWFNKLILQKFSCSMYTSQCMLHNTRTLYQNLMIKKLLS